MRPKTMLTRRRGKEKAQALYVLRLGTTPLSKGRNKSPKLRVRTQKVFTWTRTAHSGRGLIRLIASSDYERKAWTNQRFYNKTPSSLPDRWKLPWPSLSVQGNKKIELCCKMRRRASLQVISRFSCTTQSLIEESWSEKMPKSMARKTAKSERGDRNRGREMGQGVTVNLAPPPK